MANWTPEGLIGQSFKTTGKHVPPPAGLKSPAPICDMPRRRTGCKCFAIITDRYTRRLPRLIVALLQRCNTGGPTSLILPSEYLEVVVTARTG